MREKVETGDIETVTQPEESEGVGERRTNSRSYRAAPAQPEERGGKEEREKPLGRKSAKAGPDRAEAAAKGAHKRRA